MSVEMSGYTYTGLMKAFEGLDLDSTTMRNEYDEKTWKMAKWSSLVIAVTMLFAAALPMGLVINIFGFGGLSSFPIPYVLGGVGTIFLVSFTVFIISLYKKHKADNTVLTKEKVLAILDRQLTASQDVARKAQETANEKARESRTIAAFIETLRPKPTESTVV